VEGPAVPRPLLRFADRGLAAGNSFLGGLARRAGPVQDLLTRSASGSSAPLLPKVF
jgi:hypothetical protein